MANSHLENMWLKKLFKIPTSAEREPYFYNFFQKNFANLLAIPIWFNRFLKTKFDAEISNAGFNFVKDLFPKKQPLTQFNGLKNVKIRILRTIKDNIPQDCKDKILNSRNCFVTVIPKKKKIRRETLIFFYCRKPGQMDLKKSLKSGKKF